MYECVRVCAAGWDRRSNAVSGMGCDWLGSRKKDATLMGLG